MADEMDSMLLSLIEKEIPDGRNALIDSHKNLAVLSEYCKENYINSPDKSKALDETKSYASQSLSSVAYQIHSLAVNMLQLMDQQHIQLQNMQSTANNIGLQVDIHKEKVARREIGVLTSSKNFSRSHKIVPPAQQEKPHKYKREEIDYSVLDTIGHGVKTDRNHDYQRRQSTSSSSGSLKAQSVSSVHSSSQGSLHSVSQTSQSTNDSKRHLSSAPAPPRPPVAPMAPSKPKTSVTSMSPQNVPSNPPPPPPPPAAPNSNMPPPPMFMPTPDYEDTHQLPPPPPDMDDLYQIPTNNALADDLPPPPPDSFDEPLPPPAPMEPPNEIGEKVIAIYDYQKLRDDELELTEGDVLFVIKKNDDGWFEGIKDGLQGLFPGNYVTPYM